MPIITKIIANSIIPNNYTNAITFTQKPGLQYNTSAIFPTYLRSNATANLLFHLDAGNPASYSGSGSTWNDLAGSGLTTTLYNSPTYSSDNGGYLSFVASSSHYAQTSASLSVLTTWTIEVWHYYNGTFSGDQPCILAEVHIGAGINYFLGSIFDATPPALQVGFYQDGFKITSGLTLPANGWYHLVGTYDGSNVKLYVNNVLTQTYATNTTPTSSGSGIRFMRRWDFGDYWGGRLAIVKIYDTAISNGDVTTNYNANRARFGL